MPGGGRPHPLVDRQLVRVVGGLESLERPPQGRLGLGEEREALSSPPRRSAVVRTSRSASATASKHPPTWSRSEMSADREASGPHPVEGVREPLGPLGHRRVGRGDPRPGVGPLTDAALPLRRPACRLRLRRQRASIPAEVGVA